ncbi:hypothetical protein F2Q68_00004286 [Brassica cretica]|uniref:Uncharacterized protein n=1 Tax=Brassica cretica TaxID=69181 RepID=A0A8S9JAQ3_BRACR|nr:hypothetical protein F2Q68_00004286 [Brassica cretica]
MSGNTKDKIAVRNNAGKTTPAAIAHMANDYANAIFGSFPSTHTARSLRSDRAQANSPLATYRPARPQKGPPLRSHLNPHRNAFRFVLIGVSVEILRRKQVGLFLVFFHSLRSDLSDRHSLHSNLSGLRKVLLWVLF